MKRQLLFGMLGGWMALVTSANAADMVIDLKEGVVTETFRTAPLPRQSAILRPPVSRIPRDAPP